MPDEVYGFNRRDSEAVTNLIDRNGSWNSTKSGYAEEARTAIAYTHSGTITARSGTTVGTGVAKLAQIGASDVLEFVKDSTNSDIVITVKNTSTSAIGASQYIQVKRDYYSGFWLVDVGECA